MLVSCRQSFQLNVQHILKADAYKIYANCYPSIIVVKIKFYFVIFTDQGLQWKNAVTQYAYNSVDEQFCRFVN